MKQTTSGWMWVMCLAAGVLAGCQPPAPPPANGGPIGPTLDLKELVSRINQNNQRIPSLWANVEYFEAQIYEKPGDKEPVFLNGGGTFMLLKPRWLYFLATKDIAGTLVEMGSDPEKFWLTVPQRNTVWVGQWKNVGRPCMTEMPIRPDLILDVLGVGDINPDLAVAPVPTVRVNPDARVYMVVWSQPLEDRWYAQREVWYDLETLLPNKVILFDLNGRVVLRANLFAHKGVAIEGVPRDRWPKVASRLRLFFPETRSTMRIDLGDVYLKRNNRPDPRLIRMTAPENFRKIQIDEACD